MERVTLYIKMTRWMFWGILIYTAFVSTVAIMIQCGWISFSQKNSVTYPHAESIKPTTAFSMSEVAFAERFIREYFFWTQGKEDARAERLKPFWAAHLDVQGGLYFNGSSWNSYVRNVDVWDIKARKADSRTKDVIVYVETILTKVNHPSEQKRVDRYVTVSIQKAGASYVVTETPHLISPPIASPSMNVDVNKQKGEPVDETVRSQVERFMKSFWKVYTIGDTQEISYFYKNDSLVQGLTGILHFKEMNHLSIHRVNHQVVVKCNVVLEDIASKVEMTSLYSFVLTRDQERWYVVKMREGAEVL